MSKEAREAAERIVNAQRFWTGTVPFGPGYLDIDERDVMRVARDYLTEHYADDDERATVEWVSSLSGAVPREHYVVFHAKRGNGFRVQFSFDQDGGYTIQIGLTVIYDGLPQRRGDVRRLLAALGIEVRK